MTIFRSLRARFIRWDRRQGLSKRQQFVLVTLTLTVGLMLTQLVSRDFRYPMTIMLSVATYGLSAFALRDDLRRTEWFTLLILPTLFTSAIALFYFLLPARWLTRIPVVFLYALGMYALLLTENIYNVAADRTIALLRAAHSVGFLITIATFFLLVQTVMAFRFSFYINALLIGLTSYILSFQSLWSSVLENVVSREVKYFSLGIALVLGEISWALSFWPTQPTLIVLLLTTVFYSTTGMGQQYLVQKLYKKTAIEFFIVCSIVCILVIGTTHWRGNY